MSNPRGEMDLNLLPLFVRIYERGSLTEAAKELGMSQSGLSSALQKMRRALDDPLFERRAGRMLPTERSRRLYARVPELLQALHESVEDRGAAAAGPAPPSPLRLLADPWVQDCVLPALSEALGQHLHQTGILVAAAEEGGRPDPEALRGFHLVFAAPGSCPGWIGEALYQEDWVCALAPGHPAAVNEPIPLGDYLRLTHLVIAGASRLPLQRLDGASSKRPARIEVEDSAAATRLMAHADLALTCPRRFAEARGWVARPLPFAIPPRRVWLHRPRPAVRAGSSATDALQLLAERLIERLKD